MPFVLDGGQQLNIALTILIITYFYVNNKKFNIYALCLIVSLLPFYYISGGRAGIISLILFISFYLVKSFKSVFAILLIIISYIYSGYYRSILNNSSYMRFSTLENIINELNNNYYTLMFGHGIGFSSWLDMFFIHFIYEQGLLITLSIISIIILNLFKYKFQFQLIYIFLIYFFLTLISEAMFTDKIGPLLALSIGILWEKYKNKNYLKFNKYINQSLLRYQT